MVTLYLQFIGTAAQRPRKHSKHYGQKEKIQYTLNESKAMNESFITTKIKQIAEFLINKDIYEDYQGSTTLRRVSVGTNIAIIVNGKECSKK